MSGEPGSEGFAGKGGLFAQVLAEKSLLFGRQAAAFAEPLDHVFHGRPGPQRFGYQGFIQRIPGLLEDQEVGDKIIGSLKFVGRVKSQKRVEQ
jgi:hypothetical protein